MALIREDCYGLYVKNGGYIARPVPSEFSDHIPDALNNNSKYAPGQKIKARHLGGSRLHEVGDEIWYNHGCYLDNTRNNSTDCWEPRGHFEG